MKCKEKKQRKGSITSKIIMIVAIIGMVIAYLYNTKIPNYIAMKKKNECIEDRYKESVKTYNTEIHQERAETNHIIKLVPKGNFRQPQSFFYKKPIEYLVDSS